MAVGQTIHPQRRVKRAANKAKNEELRAKNQHPKQLRNKENQLLHITKEHHGGLDRAERRYLEKHYPGELAMNFTGAISSDERRRRGEFLRTVIKRDKRIKKKFKAMQLSTEKATHQMSESFRVLEDVQLISLGIVLDDPRQ